MYKHVVLWKIKENVNGKSRSQLANEIKIRLEELPTHISEIVDFEVATNIGEYGASFFDVSLIATYENKDTFWAYTKYPIHDDVVSFIQSVQQEEHIVDYEI